MRSSIDYVAPTFASALAVVVAVGCSGGSDVGSNQTGVGGSTSTPSTGAGSRTTTQTDLVGGSGSGGSSPVTSTAGTTNVGTLGGGTTGSAVGGQATAGRGSTASSEGGAATGGAATGGAATGGAATGGAATGGAATGGAATGGAATAGGSISVAGTPGTVAGDNSFIVQSPSGIVDKMDILFSIDNSLSMGDKQQVLAAAVPQLLRRLTNPDCVDSTPNSTVVPVQVADPAAACPTGLQREFSPIRDIHIGIVTSSLGDFGGDVCPEAGAQNQSQNDHAWLVGALPRTNNALPTFLGWTKAEAAGYASSIGPKLTEFKTLVSAAGELGCGIEMPLEAWYRFLIDPKPPTDVTTTASSSNVRGPVDNNILTQRKVFLRPDSLVAIVTLSDENDCSMRDDTYAWVPMTAASGFRMWRGSSICASNPNDPCCFSCMLASNASAACQALDTTCTQSDTSAKLAPAADDVNMRCRSMKKRFGFDFLFPTTRYVNALTKLQLCPDQTYGDLDCDCTAAHANGVACIPGTPVPNPLFQNLDSTYVPTSPVRLDASSVFLAGIVGVPWQDLAVPSSIAATAPLKYQLATELNWDLFAPKDNLTPPLDPLMVEQSAPRNGTQPITGEAIASANATTMANSINGHEWNTVDKDLQFACVFSLDQPIAAADANATRVCDLESACGAAADTDAYKVCARRFDGCSCTLTAAGTTATNPLDPTVSHSPLCQAANGTYGNTQYFAKAYPGLRELQVLRGFYEVSNFSHNNAIAASICPKDLNFANAAGPGYGYNPAVRSLVDRLKDNIGGTCLPQPLVADATTGKVPCSVIEAITPQGAAEGSCNCAAKQRDDVDSATQLAMRKLLERRGICNGTGCEQFCFCQLRQLLTGTPAGDACLNDKNAADTTSPPGFCYVNPPTFGNATLVADCDANEKRTIRIVGNTALGLGAPAKGPVFYSCSGSPYVAGSTATP